jgi:CRP/FNR family transcriptional regulator
MSERCNGCCALQSGICSTLTAEELERLSVLGHTRALQPGQALLWESAEAAVVANIKSGVVKLTTLSGEGREQIVGLAYPGQFIGRPFADRSVYSAVAIGPVELCLFSKPEFERFLETHPSLALDLLRRTLDDLDDARRLMLLLGRGSAEQRVATLLLSLARQCGADGAFDLPLGRQQMADVLGLTIETVSRQLTNLKRGGVIALSGRRGVALTRADRLEALAA